MEREIKFLREENAILRSKATSRNSSLPPSKDITGSMKGTAKKGKSSGKKPGGQSGHKGSNLEFSHKPDQVVDIRVKRCLHCEADLSEVAQTVVDRQQVIDIPPVKPVTIEYVKYNVVCPCCSKISASTLPVTEVKSKIQHGPQIQTWATYFNVRQVVSKGRVQELFCDLFDLALSKGTITNMVARSARNMRSTYEQLRQQILGSSVIGADETSCNVSGKNHRMWAYQNLATTFMYIHPSRGYNAIISQFPEGFKNATLVTDRWAAQLKTPSKEKQVCLQHLLRDTQKLIDTYSSRWAAKMQALLHEIIRTSHLKRIPEKIKGDIEEKLDDLLTTPLARSHIKIKTLQENLKTHQRAITTCLVSVRATTYLSNHQ